MSLRLLPDVPEGDILVHPLIVPLLLGPTGRSPLTVEEIAETLLPTIRTAQPRGPYRLIGYSFGGLLAYERAAGCTPTVSRWPGWVSSIPQRQRWSDN